MRISIVIPVLNEEKVLPDLLRLLNERSAGFVKEIIVVDGGSSDSTCSMAEKSGVKLLYSEKGRAKQLNKGAQLASGEILYFLHADSQPPDRYDQWIVEAVQQGWESGCFRMQFDSKHLLLRFFGWLTRFNSSLCRGGDQSLFVTRNVFEKSGNYNENLVIFEDNEILPRIRKHSKFRVIQKKIITSARRYHENGVLRLQYRFMRLHTKYRLGVPHEELLAYYKKHVKQ